MQRAVCLGDRITLQILGRDFPHKKNKKNGRLKERIKQHTKTTNKQTTYKQTTTN
jgi:hypothetical protein